MAVKAAAFQWGKFSPKALSSIRQSTAFVNIWEGSVRSGKTISSLVRWIEYIAEAPEGDLAMIGKTERTLKRNILDPIEKMVGKKNFKYKRGTGEAFLYGKLIYVVGANDERSEGKIRGLTLAGAYGDEVTLWPMSFFQMLLSRLSVKDSKFFGTTNPDSPYHWLKTEYIDKSTELNLRVFSFQIDDNPNLDADFVKNLKTFYTGLWYKRFILGLWVLAEGSVYDMWNEKLHVKKANMKTMNKFIVSVDYGTRNPCTFGLYGWNSVRPGSAIHLVSEYWYDSLKSGRQKSDKQYADDFVKWLNGVWPEVVYVDPSALSFIAELRGRGYNVVAANNDVIDGIRFVGSLLSNGQFFVDPSCGKTLMEFSSYIWDGKAQKKGEDKPLKQHDHTMDRNRYALYTHFAKFRQWSAYSNAI